jgi:hypothetical protein
VWVAASDKGVNEGVAVLVKDSGIRCITAPCPSLMEMKLNSNLSATITDLDLEASGATAEVIDRGFNGIYDGGVIVVGDRYYGSNGLKGRRANQFFTKAPVPLF